MSGVAGLVEHYSDMLNAAPSEILDGLRDVLRT